VKAQPMITCSSVAASSTWYQEVLGFESAHGGDEYEMLCSEGQLVLQLHEIDAHEHPHLVREGEELHGNGVALWFEADDYHGAVARIERTDAQIVEHDHVNPLARHREIWLRDPDGYAVVVSSPFGVE
jgi:catechol 2,3-dioxygenase-like lactoylglutathione lyase family enzyme